MKVISLKTIVGLANILVYLALVLLFLCYGYPRFKLNDKAIISFNYVFFAIALVFNIIYQLLRIYELRKSKFQLTRKHFWYGRYFYIGQYLVLIFLLLNIVFNQIGIFNSNDSKIWFYVIFPIIFVQATVGSVLESIIRVEEKIYINKKAWNESQKWEEEQKAQVNKVKKQNLPIDNFKDENPFF